MCDDFDFDDSFDGGDCMEDLPDEFDGIDEDFGEPSRHSEPNLDDCSDSDLRSFIIGAGFGYEEGIEERRRRRRRDGDLI